MYIYIYIMSTFSLFAYNPTDVNTLRLFDLTFTFSLYLKSSYAKIWELSILSLHVIQFILVILHSTATRPQYAYEVFKHPSPTKVLMTTHLSCGWPADMNYYGETNGKWLVTKTLDSLKRKTNEQMAFVAIFYLRK